MSSSSLASSRGSFDSLFDERDSISQDDTAVETDEAAAGASRTTPPIPGLYIFADLLDPDIAQTVLEAISELDIFVGGKRDQAMFFPSPASPLPTPLLGLLDHLAVRLAPLLPPAVYCTVFGQQLSRQVIVNLYAPGTGITSHIDLPHRYADGILGTSLTGRAVMEFTHSTGARYGVYLPPRSVYVLTGEARREWAHGISQKGEDWVEGVRIFRDTRVSVTYRWMKHGADALK